MATKYDFVTRLNGYISYNFSSISHSIELGYHTVITNQFIRIYANNNVLITIKLSK